MSRRQSHRNSRPVSIGVMLYHEFEERERQLTAERQEALLRSTPDDARALARKIIREGGYD